MGNLDRRTFLKGAAGGAGAFLLSQPAGALARSLGGLEQPAAGRSSRLTSGTRLVHADLHNHTLLSDGAGRAEEAFATMRSHGLDVAALTDHSTISQELPLSGCGPVDDVAASQGEDDHPCQSLAGINEGSWEQLRTLADGADDPGRFTAIRGFEWSSPTLGHMNVWFSRDWADPLHTGGLGSPEDFVTYARSQGLDDPAGFIAAAEQIVKESPAAGAGMRAWQTWLAADPAVTGVGGGDGLIGFNHPGREPGRFSDFALAPELVERTVSLELFNRDDDYLFELVDEGRTSPLVVCLDSGWRTGILGVTDEHGTDWGRPQGKGRTGLWVEELSRDGVREALLARRFFATNEVGLRLDATANGVRMGSTLPHRSGRVRLALDLDRGPGWWGKPLSVQLLRTGSPLPEVVRAWEVTVPTGGEAPVTLTAEVDADDGDWLVLRVSDPALEADGRADDLYAGFGRGVAYASPWWLDPEAPPPPIVR